MAASSADTARQAAQVEPLDLDRPWRATEGRYPRARRPSPFSCVPRDQLDALRRGGSGAAWRHCDLDQVTYSPSTHGPPLPSVAAVPRPDEHLQWQLDFGNRLRELRLRAELTQEELAHAAGLDRTYVGSVERGHRNPSLLSMWRLARVLSVSPASFFDGNPERRG